jgi:hypothetical protein
MKRLTKLLITVIALTALGVLATPASAARVFVGGYWGPGWGWGPGWYGPGWGPYYYYSPPAGTVQIISPDKSATVYVDGAYVGTVAERHKFSLRPGAHDLALKAPSGQTIYSQRIEVLLGKTTKIHVPA